MKKTLILIIHILAVIMCTTGIAGLYIESSPGKGITWVREENFEDSAQFSEMVNSDIANIRRLSLLKQAFEEDGKLSFSNTVVRGNTSNGMMSYTLGDLRTLAQDFGYVIASGKKLAVDPASEK